MGGEKEKRKLNETPWKNERSYHTVTQFCSPQKSFYTVAAVDHRTEPDVEELLPSQPSHQRLHQCQKGQSLTQIPEMFGETPHCRQCN